MQAIPELIESTGDAYTRAENRGDCCTNGSAQVLPVQVTFV